MNGVTMRPLFRFAFAATVLLFWLGATASGQTPPPTDENIIVSGFLSCTNHDGSPRQCPTALHQVKLSHGKTYAIRMESTEFDSALKLEDPAGICLLADLDYFDDLKGCIVFTPPTTGQYRLIASAGAPPNEGYYTITIRELPVLMQIET